MDAKTALIFTITLCILYLQALIMTTNVDEALMKKLCDATISPQVCQSCLASDPGSKSADEIGLAVISLNCVSNDVNGLSQTTLSCQQNTTDSNMKFALGVCLDWRFAYAKDGIKYVSPMIKDRNWDMVQGVTKNQIMGYVSDCASFVQSKGLQVPDVVAQGIAVVARDCQILLGIVASIK